jgi:hypothetical protein
MSAGNRYSDITGSRVHTVCVGDIAANGDLSGMIFKAPFACAISSLQILVGANVASHTANYDTITFYNGGATGAGTTSMGSLTTQDTTGGVALTANTAATVTLTSNTLDSGDIMRMVVATEGDGAALDSLSVAITYYPT